MKTKKAIAQKVLPLLTAIASLKESYNPRISRFKGVRILSSFSPSQRNRYITCDKFCTWGEEIALARHRGKYAIYHIDKGIITPFTFDEFNPISPNFLTLKWGQRWITVRISDKQVFYLVEGRTTNEFKHLLSLLLGKQKD